MSTYPTVRPSLTLDFQKSKQLDPRITFSRSSTATYVEGGLVKNAYTDQARFEEGGLLIEESRTNFLTYSVDFSQQFTAYGCSFTANTAVAPDGTITATTLIEDTANNFHLIAGYTGVPQAGNGTHTFSCFAKARERSVIALSTNQSIGKHAVATFDLQGGVVSQYGGTNDGDVDYVDSSITHIGNGWYRCSLTYTKTTGTVWPNIEIVDTPTYTYNNYGRRIRQGDGTSGVYVWGVQFEQNSSFLTSYIPTAGSTVTRSADVLQITGDNFNSWFNQDKGSLAVDINVPKKDLGRQILSILETPTTSINSFRGIGITQGSIGGSDYVNRMVWWIGGTRHTSGPVVPYEGKFAQSFEAVGTGGLAVNGSITYNATNLSKNVTLTGLFANSTFTCKRISFYSERLTNEQLEAITS